MKDGEAHRTSENSASFLAINAEIGQSRNPDGDVEAVLDQIDQAVVEGHVEQDFGIFGGEFDDRQTDLQIGQRARRRNPQSSFQAAAGLAHRVLQIGNPAQDVGSRVVVELPGLGQRKLASRAVEQQDAEFVLQFAHIFRHQRLGTADAARRRRKAFGIDNIQECLHSRQRVQGGAPPGEGPNESRR